MSSRYLRSRLPGRLSTEFRKRERDSLPAVIVINRSLVYPRPGQPWIAPGDNASHSDDGGDGTGSEDFAGLRNYVAGDQPSRIDWKSYARDRGLNTRLFSGQSDAPLWILWEDAPGTDHEARLSALCRAVLDAEAAGRQYGLRTANGAIEPDSGTSHRHKCLRQLALDGHQDA